MSSPRYGWWSYAKHMVRKYPDLKKKYEELHRQRITPAMGQLAGKGSPSRTVENTALRQLPPARQREYDAVTKAIERTKLMKTGQERLTVVDMVLWQGTHNIDGAALKIHVSETTARRYHTDFIRLVGFCYGLEDWEESSS